MTRTRVHAGSPTTGLPQPSLRIVRSAQGLALREAARQSNTDPGQLSRIERGLETPSVPTLYRIARTLGLTTLADLLAEYVPQHKKAL